MNRKALIQLTTAVAVATALCSGASAATPAGGIDPQAAQDLGAARNAWTECVRAAIPKLDDSVSPSEDIARAAMKACAEKYSVIAKALPNTLAPRCSQDSECARQASETAQRDAVKAATDEVMAARVRVAGAQVLICQ